MLMLRLLDCGSYGKSGMLDVLARIGFWPPNLHKVHRPYS